MPARVLVVGGGIAGLSCAIALRGHGFSVDVVEVSGKVWEEGLNITGRGVDGLADLGILTACVERGTAQGSPLFDQVFDSSGRRREITQPAPRSPLPSSVIIFRQTLAEILTEEALAAGASIEIQRTVESIDQFSDSVLVSFDNGAFAEYDLVVGADGLRSGVRRLLWGDAIQPVYSGVVDIRWMVDRPPSPAERGFYYAPGKVVFVGLLADGRTCLAAPAPSDNMLPTMDESRELLRDVLSHYTAPYLRSLRDHIDENQPVIARPWEWLWVDEWVKDRVVLIGDAAHATTAYIPAGVGMAVVDAVVLAEELAEAESIADGLAAFSARRKDRSRLVVDTSVRMARMHREGADQRAIAGVFAAAMRTLAQPY